MVVLSNSVKDTSDVINEVDELLNNAFNQLASYVEENVDVKYLEGVPIE